MTANIATPQSMSLAARTARSVADTRTPFYNNLMTMIDATALENRRVSQDPEAAGVLRTASPGEHGLRWAGSTSGWVGPRWSIGQVLTCAAGAVAAVAVVGAIVGSVGSIREQPAVAADSSPGRTPLMVASTADANTADKAVERAASPTAKADTLAPTASKAKEAAETGTETVAVPAAKSEALPDVKLTAGRPESEGAGANIQRASAESQGTADVKTVSVKIVAVTAAVADVDEVADPPIPMKVTSPDVVAPAESSAKQPQPAGKAVSPAPPIETGSIKTGSIKTGSIKTGAIETGAIETGATGKAPDAVRIGRIASGVRLRAGPSNAEAVLGTLPKGAAVEVVGCRAWCEVLFNGQRGWIYKSFLAGPR